MCRCLCCAFRKRAILSSLKPQRASPPLSETSGHLPACHGGECIFFPRQLMRCIHPRMCCTSFFVFVTGARLPVRTIGKQLCERVTPTSCQRWWNELISGECTDHWSLSRRALLEPFGTGTSLTLGCIKFEHESTGAEGDNSRLATVCSCIQIQCPPKLRHFYPLHHKMCDTVTSLQFTFGFHSHH